MNHDETTTAGTAATQAVVLDRTFDAPVDVVWQMWTTPEHFAAWYGPTGARVPLAEMDVRVGGRRRICMEMGTPDGVMQMWFVGEYREVDPPRRLVYTEVTADAEGSPAAPHGMPEGHPTETEVIVELEDLGARTRVTLTHRGVPADSPGAMGWRMALDKLADHLAAVD